MKNGLIEKVEKEKEERAAKIPHSMRNLRCKTRLVKRGINRLEDEKFD